MALANGSVTRQTRSEQIRRRDRTAFLLALWVAATPLLGVLARDAAAAACAVAPALALLALRPLWIRPRIVEGACLAWAAAVVAWGVATQAGLSAWLLAAPPAAAAAALGRRPGAGAALALASAAALLPWAGAGQGPPAEAAVFGPASLVFALLLLLELNPLAAPRRAIAQPSAEDGEDARLLAELGHELRTPLTHILGFAEVIELRLMGPAEEKYSEYARVIRASGRHLLDLAETWLELGRLDAGARALRPQPVDLVEIAGAALEAASLAAEQKAVQLEFEGPPAAPVEADPGAWRQILTNLLGNAIKFAPENGRVRLTVMALASLAVIEVEDDGPGVPEAERARLAQPWRQGRAGLQAGGAGLGLALVRRLAEMQGGALEIGDSALGGALFRVSAPILRRGPIRQDEAARLEEGQSGGEIPDFEQRP